MTLTAQSEINVASPVEAKAGLVALLRGTAVLKLDDMGWIRATGVDRVRWLNGMVTNSVQALQTGTGNYNFLLSVQGRIQGDATIFAEPEALLMETAAALVPDVMKLLDRYIIMDDVELANISAERSGLLVAGPEAASLLETLHLPVAELEPLAMKTVTWNSAEVMVLHAYSPLVPRFELWAEPSTTAALKDAISAAGAVVCGPQSREWLRLLEGTPRYGTDIRDRELPQETAQTRALHFTKGCYLGQEIVERIRSRGNVHRTFCAFRLEGTLPNAGVLLEVDTKQVGELTSVASIPLPGDAGSCIQLALGYIRREALDRNVPLLYQGGIALPVSLPYSVTGSSLTATSI